jgi:hypothetical protein
VNTANCLGGGQPGANNQGDAHWYYVVYSAPNLILSDINGNPVNYVADMSCPSGTCTVGFETSFLLGGGTQPFMVGIQNYAFYLTSLALAGCSPCAPQLANMAPWALGNANWTASTGLNSTTKGLYYGRGFVSCEPPSSANPGCDSGTNGDRELNGEGINVATYARRLNPTSATAKTLGYTMMDALWSWNPGDPGYDGLAPVSDIQATTGFFYNGSGQSKWTGYYWGIGANWSWQAANAALGNPKRIGLPIMGGGQIASIGANDVRMVLGIRRYF